MKALAALQSLPHVQFRRYRSFYVWYDLAWGALALGLSGLLWSTGFRGLLPEFELWTFTLLPLALYLVILAHVFIHNASHGNFPKSINRLVGELCGAIVLSKFASWQIVHRRHHRYSDDPERDPHPAERSYWRYAWNTLIKVEQQLQQEYYDTHGDTPANHRRESVRSVLSFVSGLLLAVLWFVLLGPGGFFMIYLPAFVGAALFVIHFNWSGHNAHNPQAPIEPTDLDTGWFWLGNRLFFGIYYHGTHHRLSMLFNPMRGAKRARAVEEDSAGAAAE